MALFAGLWILLVWGLLAWMFGLQPGWIYSVGGSVLFCGYILYDTWRLSQTYGYEDYLLAAIDLYLDILNLFLYILRLVSETSNRN